MHIRFIIYGLCEVVVGRNKLLMRIKRIIPPGGYFLKHYRLPFVMSLAASGSLCEAVEHTGEYYNEAHIAIYPQFKCFTNPLDVGFFSFR